MKRCSLGGLPVTLRILYIFLSGISALNVMVNPVVVIGLNPALQRTITLPRLEAGEVIRASSSKIGIGGKGWILRIETFHTDCEACAKVKMS